MSALRRPEGPLVEVDDLHVEFRLDRGVVVKAVDGLSFTLDRGERLAIVGESGSGKSVTALSLMQLLERSSRVRATTLRFAEVDLLKADRHQLEDLRGRRVAMVFQDPLTALDPVFTIGQQIVEAIRHHEPGTSKRDARTRVEYLLNEVGIPDPARCARSYPHQLSGGMRQRAMIASALACGPELLLADEPTTALDVTVQAQIVELLGRLADDRQMAVILITHDLGVVAGFTRRVLVMYAGHAVEVADVDTLFHHPCHPYTEGLLGSVARLDRPPGEDLPTIPGVPPSLASLPPGCAFAPRCPRAADDCRVTRPELAPHAGRLVACYHPLIESSL